VTEASLSSGSSRQGFVVEAAEPHDKKRAKNAVFLLNFDIFGLKSDEKRLILYSLFRFLFPSINL